MSTCNCKLWDKNIEAYNSMYNFTDKYHGPAYDGQEFAFCPWCGVELELDEEDFEFDEEEDEDEDEEEIDLTPMHGDEEDDDDEDDDDDYDEEYEIDFELEPEEITFPVLSSGWCSKN